MTVTDRTQKRLAREAARVGKELPRECRARVDSEVDAWLLEIDEVLEPQKNLGGEIPRH